MAVAWPLVRAALWSQLPALLPGGYRSYNGPVPDGSQPQAYLTIGRAPSADNDGAGSFTQTNGRDGFSAAETGIVLGELGAVTGSASVPNVFAAFDAIVSHVQEDMTLGGVLHQGSTVTVTASVVEAVTTAGAVQRLLISFDYVTNI